MKKFVVFYEAADDLASKAPPVYPAHLAKLKEFRERGALLMIGTFANPQTEGSMAIFSSREAAEEFAKNDPMVLEGVVKQWQLREWDDIRDEV